MGTIHMVVKVGSLEAWHKRMKHMRMRASARSHMKRVSVSRYK